MDITPALMAAISALILDANAPSLYANMMLLAVRQSNLLALSGRAEVLTPLLALYQSDRDKFDRIMDLVDSKRINRGWEALRVVQDGFDKVEYQRQFMDQKRQRERRIADIENEARPPRDRLIGNARLEFMRVQSSRWKARRDEMIAAARVQAGGQLSKSDMQARLEAFWRGIDRELDQMARK